MELTDDDIAGLGRKLQDLDLTDGERALLNWLVSVDLAGAREVEAFGVVYEIEVKSRVMTHPYFAKLLAEPVKFEIDRNIEGPDPKR